MEKDYKVKAVLQAARHRKRGMLLKEISEAIGEAVSTVHGWLMRLEEGMERRYDRKSPGRPCRLSDAQKEALGGDLDKSPEKSAFSAAYGRPDSSHVVSGTGSKSNTATGVPSS